MPTTEQDGKVAVPKTKDHIVILQEAAKPSIRLGLGCSRLGSVLGASRKESEKLIRSAVEMGIDFFDTADIYGQGESERLLGLLIGNQRKDITIVTKGGQYFPFHLRAIRPMKSLVAPLINSSMSPRSKISTLRSHPLPQDFSRKYLEKAVERSLRRLNTDVLDVYLLHSPSAEVLKSGEAIGTLKRLKTEGKIRRIGTSCDTSEANYEALSDESVEFIEFQLGSIHDQAGFLKKAKQSGKFTIARGVLQSVKLSATANQEERTASITTAIRAAFNASGISTILIGTTNINHLREAVEAASRAEKLVQGV